MKPLISTGHLPETQGQLDRVKERFWSNVNIRNPNECWEWIAGKNSGGYGTVKINRKSYTAHRVSYELSHGHGSIPKDILVLHRCDNRQCVNPDHLFLGTQYDNVHDMIKKGRSNYLSGPNHYANKTSKETAETVIRMYLRGRKIEEIATLIGISGSTVGRILAGDHWTSKSDPSIRNAVSKAIDIANDSAKHLRKQVLDMIAEGHIQTEVAECFKISQSFVSEIVRGVHRNHSLPRIRTAHQHDVAHK